MIESNNSGANGDSSIESPSRSANTSTNAENKKENDKESSENSQKTQNLNNYKYSLNQEKHYCTKLPWGVLKETPNLSNNLFNLILTPSNVNINDDIFKIEKKKPGEYLMNLVVFNFIQLSSKKIDQISIGEKRDKRLKECFQKNEDLQYDKLVITMGQVAEQSLPSLVRTLLMWHEAQISNLNYLKIQNQQQIEVNPLNSTTKTALKTKQHLMQAKIENEILDERKELIVNCLLCTALREILKQLPFHPGIDDLLNYIIDLSFQRFVSKETSLNASSYVQHHQLYLDNQFTTDLFSECIGVLAQSRFTLVKRRFVIEFDRLKLYKSPGQSNSSISSNLSSQTTSQQASSISTQSNSVPTSVQSSMNINPQISNSALPTGVINSSVSAPNITQTLISPSSSNIIKLLMGMKFFRIKMVPIEDFEASFQFLNDFAQYFVDVKDKDIKHTLAGLFVEILVPITGIVKNEVNIPCLKSFVDILYQHAWELSAKTKHRLATLPLLTCLLCVSQKQFFLNYWFPFAQLCFQQFKSKETTLSRIALESILRLVWVYMIRIKGEKSSDTNQRLTSIIQSIFPKGNKLVIPKEMPANIYVKIINYIAYEKLDFAFKEIIFELLSIDVSQNSTDSNDQMSSISANNSVNLSVTPSSVGTLGSQAFKNSKENMILMPLRMEIGIKAFVSIADTLQYEKENGINPPLMPSNFTTPNSDQLSLYLKNSGQINPQKVTLNDSLCKEIGLGIYFDNVRRAFQDILKTLDFTIGRTFLMTRPENTGSANNEDGANQSEPSLPTQQENASSENLEDIHPVASNKDLIFNSDNKSKLSLFRTCIALIPRVMPCFKENELVDILTRLTIHLDDELKLASFQTLKILVSDYSNWRKFIFTGFTNFILKEISDMFPKLIENALKMLIQLLNAWKSSNLTNQNLDECCQILYHLEGFSLFTLCHSNLQRRRFGLLILKECKQIGELTKCFKLYPYHNYVLDVLDLSSIQAMKQLHLQCFNSNLITSNLKPDLAYLIDQSSSWDSCVNLSNYSDNFSQSNSLPSQSTIPKNQRAPSVSNSTDTAIDSAIDPQTEPDTSSSVSSAPSSLPNNFQINFTVNFQNSPQLNSQNQTVQHNLNNIFTFDPWAECLAIFFSYDYIFTKCPQARIDAWPFIYTRLQQILPYVDPNEPHEVPRTSILFGVGSNSLEKQRKAASERDINLNLWKNYLIGACCLTSGSDRYLYYQEYEKFLIKTTDEGETLSTSQTNLLNPSLAVNVDFTVVESTSRFYANFGTATSLIKMIVPFLKCESLYFREVIIRGLGRINIEAQRDLIEELNPFVKETSDFKRQEKIRRLKKKDWTRLALVRIFELMAEQKTLSKRILDTFKKTCNIKNLHQALQQQHQNDEVQLRKSFSDFIETMIGYLESENEKVYEHINLIRIHFSMFLYKLIDCVPKEKRGMILNDTMRQNLFNLIIKWSGKFYVTSKDSAKLNQVGIQSKNWSIHQNHYHHLNCYHYYEELELAAARACASILYSGNVCDYFTNKNSLIFNWLNNLVEIANSEMRLYENCRSQVPNEIYTLSLNCLIQLLELSLYTITSSNTPSGNTINVSLNNSPIFEWVIDKCYSSLSQEIGDLCFISLSKVYLDYLNQAKPNHLNKNNLLKSSFESIYLGPILTLILLNLGSNRLNIHETSVTLLRVVNKNFLQDNFESKTESKSSTLSSANNLDPINSFLNIDFDIINSLVISSKSQAFISEYLAKKNPEQTMFIFCEITSHFESCTSNNLRRTMLNVLVPWFYNLELINPNVVSDVKKETMNNVLQLQSGYGSVEATHLILNNLFYLTCKFGDQFYAEFELLWATLASTWRTNLKIICRFISVMITLAPYEVLLYGKKVICYLSRVCPERIVDELVNELELIDSFNSIIEKCDNQFPFYKYTRPATVPVSPPPSPKPTNNSKKSSIYFVNQDDDDDEELDDESIEFVNQSDFTNLEDEDYEDEDSDDSDSEYSESESETEYFKNLKKTQASQLKLNFDASQLPLPAKFQSFACPLNKLLYHLGHHHNQQNNYHYQNQTPVYSYHNNYLHHNHYQHINYLQRGTISLMLLTELVCNDGADFDWTQYFPILLHYCLINFDNTKQLVTEHAKKLFLGLMYILTVQNELYFLTDYLVETLNNVVDNQSIIYDRKYKGPDSGFLNGSCHYNYNFNSKNYVEMSNLSLKSSSSRNLINIHSAPSSPAQTQNNQQINSSEKNKIKTGLKKNNRLLKAREHLVVLLEILSRCKNGPVWPHEQINPSNYSKQLKSVDILNEFVENLKNFLNICLSTKQISTISSTRSFSSPLNLTTRFFSGEKSCQMDKKWSLFALNTSFSTCNRHYAGRSLQIYRALKIKINSLTIMSHFVHRLKDTVADLNEDVQGYVIEILLTLKMNATVLSNEYLNRGNGKNNESNAKHKSKSLKLRQDRLEAKKKYSTAIGSELSNKMKNIDMIKQKTATLCRKQVNQILNKAPLELQRFSTKYKHQISYRKCLTLSLFNYKWQVLQDRVGTSILANRKNSKFLSLINLEQAKGQNLNESYLKVLVQIFWLSMCLLESDFEHEFSLACDILEQILNKIDLSQELQREKNEFRTNLELFAFRINWPNFPGLQNLLLKGCTSQKLNEKTQNILVFLIPYCSKINFVDPCGSSFYGLWGLSMNLLALLPTMILNYENPTDLCIKAAEEYCKSIKEIAILLDEQNKSVGKDYMSQLAPGYQKTKIEQLKNLQLVIQLYMQKSFGKDKNQWAKCVITYMSEFFNLCQVEQTTVTEDSATKTNFYFNWIVLLIEFLEKSTSLSYQSSVLTCLNSLLNYINFSDQSAWTFINEELLRVVSRFNNTELWSEVLDLIKLTVGKSSSLLENDKKTDSPRFYLNEINSQASKSQVPSSARSFYGKKELPGRTLDFDFDFSWFVPIQKNQSSPGLRKSPKSSSNLEQFTQFPPLNLLSIHSNKQYNFLNSYLNGTNLSGWKRPTDCQTRTREKIILMNNILNKIQPSSNLSQANENSSSDSHKTSLQKSPSVIFENSLNSSEQQKPEFQIEENDENLNLITNATLNNSNLSTANSLSSRISKKEVINSQVMSPNTTNSSEQSSKSSSTSANQTSSNNSFNQTSFVFSPDKDTNKDDSPKILKPKPQAPIINDNAFSRTHNRANSMSINKQGSIINIIGSGMHTYSGKTRPTGLSMANVTPGVSQQILNTIEDNIFINNTFSFLDDLESNPGDFVTKNGEKESENKEKIEYENFPWHAILPAKDKENGEQQQSQTLSINSSSDGLSKSFSSSSDMKNQLGINSKLKPVAPKIKGSATIGVATGISTLKNLVLHSENIEKMDQEKTGERRRSVTRIVSSESIDKNTEVTFKKEKPILPPNSLKFLQTNLIYDHRSEIDIEKSNESLNSSNTGTSNQYQPIIRHSPITKNINLLSTNSLLTSKPNISRLSNSNLTSPEDSQRAIALNLLNDKSKSLSKNAIDSNKNSRTNSYSNLSKSKQDQEEDQLIIEKTVKNIYQICARFIDILNLNQDEIQRAWKQHIQKMLNSTKSRTSSSKLELSLDNTHDYAKSFNPIDSFYLFKKLFNDARHRLNSLLAECYQYLTTETKLFLKLEKHLVIILELLNTKLDCPVVYFDQEWFMQLQELIQTASPNKSMSKSPLKVSNLVSVSFIDNHKRILWEIGENYDTFVYIKNDVTESLDSIKKLEKNPLSSLHGSSEINNKIEKFFKKIDLSKKFCKLVSQFMILLQSYSKLLPNLTRNLANITLTDLSVEMSNLKRNLINASQELELNGRLSPMFPVNLESTIFSKSPSFKTILPNSKEMLIYWILESLRQENYTEILEYYKIAQKNWPNDFNKNNQYGNEIDFDLILILACEQARQKNSNMIAIIETEVDFVEISQNVLQEIIEITNLVNSIDKKFKENISSVLNDNDNEDDENEELS